MEHTSCFQHTTSSLTCSAERHPLCRVISKPLLKQVLLEAEWHCFACVSEGTAKLVDKSGFHWNSRGYWENSNASSFWIRIIFTCTFTMLKLDVFCSETEPSETFGTTAKISFVLELPNRHLKAVKAACLSFFLLLMWTILPSRPPLNEIAELWSASRQTQTFANREYIASSKTSVWWQSGGCCPTPTTSAISTQPLPQQQSHCRPCSAPRVLPGSTVVGHTGTIATQWVGAMAHRQLFIHSMCLGLCPALSTQTVSTLPSSFCLSPLLKATLLCHGEEVRPILTPPPRSTIHVL